jgi:hypothetical protein
VTELSAASQPVNGRELADFWELPPSERAFVLVEAIGKSHRWHFGRNPAYRQAVSARGIGADMDEADLARLLRPTAQTFKSYIDILGTPFPQDRPHAFLGWLNDQLSVELPEERFARFRPKYGSLEALLEDVELLYDDFGLEVLTSSGTSGRSTIMVRDQQGLDRTVESFYLAFQRYMGMEADHRAIFIMPRETRIAMARMAGFSVTRVGLTEDRVHFTIPFPASPDRVRVRAGRTYRSGWRGIVERKVSHPFMNWMQEHVVTGRTIRNTLDLLRDAEANQEKVLLFGGWVQLHAAAQTLRDAGETLRLAPGSIFGSGGGLKEAYPFTPRQIREELAMTVELADGRPIPFHDAYGMAEGNWAAMQCAEANYHLPPWVFAVALDDDGEIQEGADTTGLLAFFDPYGGGNLFPAFFRTADRVRLINGSRGFDASRVCACGDDGAYIATESIQRVDLLDEAGCAAQV